MSFLALFKENECALKHFLFYRSCFAQYHHRRQNVRSNGREGIIMKYIIFITLSHSPRTRDWSFVLPKILLMET